MQKTSRLQYHSSTSPRPLTPYTERRWSKYYSDADYTDDIAPLANGHTQGETLLHSLECAAAGIGLYVNVDETEYMCFNQRGDIFTLNVSSLKIVDKFTYHGSSISSTGTDINAWLAKSIGHIGQVWPIKENAVFSKQWSCRYCYWDVLHGR